jgi:hypothetical protein
MGMVTGSATCPGCWAGFIRPDPALPRSGRVLYGTHRAAGAELALRDLWVAPFEILICEV